MTDKQSDIDVLIIEDEAIVAMDLEQRLQKIGYNVMGIHADSDKAINYLSIHRPQLILCDINIRGSKDGIDVAHYVRQHNRVPLIFVTALSDKSTLERAKKALPYGYIVKPYEDSDLISAIEMALYKHQVELEQVALTRDKLAPLCAEPLSKREYEIVQDIVKGLSNTQICDLRYISINTTKYHVSNIFRKMNVSGRAELLQKILTVFTQTTN